MNAICGLKRSESFAYLDPDTGFLRTSQASLIADISDESSVIFPKAGMMRNGVLSELTMSAPHIEGKGCGYWRTPQARDWKGPSGRSMKGLENDLPNSVRGGTQTPQKYPTPGTTGMSNGSGNCEKANKLYLAGQIDEATRKSMRAGNGGQLNPDWVEWLMGWLIGQTDLKPLEMDKFQQWRQQHGEF